MYGARCTVYFCSGGAAAVNFVVKTFSKSTNGIFNVCVPLLFNSCVKRRSVCSRINSPSLIGFCFIYFVELMPVCFRVHMRFASIHGAQIWASLFIPCESAPMCSHPIAYRLALILAAYTLMVYVLFIQKIFIMLKDSPPHTQTHRQRPWILSWAHCAAEYYFLNLRHENANLMGKDIKVNHIPYILCTSIWTVEHIVYLLSANKIQNLLHRLE